VRVENSDEPGITIGRIRRHSSDDEACISALLEYIDPNLYTVAYVALSDSDKSYKSSMLGFDVSVKLSCKFECNYDSLLEFLSGYNISEMNFV
jgi:hypothetical protein